MFLWPSTTPGSVSTSMSFMRRPLVLGEVAHLRLREVDVVEVLLRQAGDAGLDLGVGQPEVLAVPVVELHRQLAHRRVAARLDVGENAFDRRPDLRVVLRPQRRVPAALEISAP